jgi:3-methyladenine DNA glycosylase AlkD
MNKHHQELLEELKKNRGINIEGFNISKYLGNDHPYYNIPVPLRRSIVKSWIRKNQQISLDEYVGLLDSLFKGESHDEKTLGGMLLTYKSDFRKKLNPRLLEGWIEQLQGWAEIDSLCQSSFKAEDMLDNWLEWSKFLKKMNKSEDVRKIRSSLVLLVKPVSQSDDKRFVDLAFKNIDNLKNENDILITKAISWLLRSLIKNHGAQVGGYLAQNIDFLPKFVVKEVNNKLVTGRKSKNVFFLCRISLY